MNVQKNAYLYAGGFSFDNPDICGLHAFSYDTDTGALTHIGRFGDHQGTSSVTIDGNLLFATLENHKEDLALSYRINNDGSLTELDSVHTGAFCVDELALDTKDRFLFLTDFDAGSVTMIAYDEAGKLEVTDSYAVPGEGNYITGLSTVKRQSRITAHCVRMMPDGNHICVCCLGTDCVYIFSIDTEDKKLIPLPELTVTLDYGEGARNMSFSPDGKYMYLNTEMGNTLYVLAVGDDCSLTRLQKLSTLDPERENPDHGGFASVTKVSADGRYVFTANRGQNNIAGFKVNSDGTLSPNGFFDTYGESPRNMTFGYEDSVLFVCNNASGDIAVLEYDKETGKPGRCIQKADMAPGASYASWCILPQ